MLPWLVGICCIASIVCLLFGILVLFCLFLGCVLPVVVGWLVWVVGVSAGGLCWFVLRLLCGRLGI